MRQAAQETVPLDQLHGAACRRIAPICETEAALVTCGASAALMLGAAAIMARFDLSRIELLPQTDRFPHEFIVARSQRHGYDHAIRAAGGRLIEVGMDEVQSGAGVRRVELWEFEQAIGSNTAGILFTLTPGASPDLTSLVAIAHAHQVPVLVDAAAQLPPVSNLARVSQTGADLIAWSGGKALGGPQATGILCGRRDLVGSAYLQMIDLDEHWELWDPPAELIDRDQLPGLPRHGIGRALKVSKEPIVGLLTALDRFTENRMQASTERFSAWLARLQNDLAQRGIASEYPSGPMPTLEIPVDRQRLGRTAVDVCRSLRAGSPPVYVGHGQLMADRLVIHPQCLSDTDVEVLSRRLTDELRCPDTPAM
jgi:L-seryl-tRNA(Ser) seleniumtransferase